MKRLLSLVLVLAMVLTLAPMNIGAADADKSVFSDVRGSEYYAEAANVLEQLKVLTGYPDGTFGAEKFITRAEMAAIVCRMIGKGEEAMDSMGKTDFDDVESAHWASGYINVASRKNIINGDGTGSFNPEDDVKYEEALKMIVCALGYADEAEADPKDWSKGYLNVADARGISRGLKGSKGKAATRGDIALMSYNGLGADVEAPKASLRAGNYSTERSTRLTTTTKDAEIYYTLNGSVPTVKSAKYTKAIAITKSCTLKAITVKNGVLVSDVMTAKYTITKQGPSRPSVPTYSVSFDLNYEGATGAPETQSVRSGNKATKPLDPEREGYVFLCWSTDKDTQVPFDFTSEITGPVTLYALWETVGSNTVSVTFILNDGSAGAYEMQRVIVGGYATRPAEPQRELYEFTGWYTEAEAINKFDFSEVITEEKILYAGWGSPDGNGDLYGASSGGGTEYAITGIEMTDSRVNVTVNTNEESVLTVKFLDENTEEIITSVSTQTPSYCELVPVVIPVNYQLPEHYIIVADLYDNNSAKRCESYTSIKHTSAYEAFDKQTVNDFEKDRVISFDGSNTNNFGVFSEGVKRIDSSDSVNKLTVENAVGTDGQLITDRKYIIENADESVLTLAVGDSVYINGTSYLFKIGAIENENGKVIISESGDTQLKDFYDVLKVDMNINTEEPNTMSLLWDAVDSETSFTIGGDINWAPNNWLNITGTLSGTGTVKLEITYDWKLLQDDYFYIALITSLDLDVGLEIAVSSSTEDNDDFEIKICEIPVPTPVPGLVLEAEASIPMILEASAGINVEFTAQMETGFTYSSYDGRQNIDKKERTIKLEAEGNASLRFGPQIELELEFCEDVLEAEIVAGAGIEAEISTSVGAEHTTGEEKHDCTLCLEGTMNWYAEVYADVTYEIIDDVLEGEIGKWYIVNVTGQFPSAPDFYMSIINNDDSVFGGKFNFGWGECPNKVYRTRITVKDSHGNEISGTNVSVRKQNGNTAKSGPSPFTAYLYNGRYTASASIEGAEVSKTVVVSDEAQDIVLAPDSDDGSVYGMVVDSITGNPVSGATVIISRNGAKIATATSGSDGSYQVSLGDGIFSIETTKNGYIPFNEYVTISNAVTTYLQTTKLVPGDKNAKGGFGGRIVDSVNGQPVEGVTLKLRKGWNNRSEGEVIETLTTDANGEFLYEIKYLFGVPVKLEVGNYTLTATKNGYATVSHNIIVRPDLVTGGQDFSMSPSLGDGKYRIVLRWGLNPCDLDSHLVGPAPGGNRFHTWYNDKRYAEGGNLVADLDLDDITSYGPETTTIHVTSEGKYYFYVHHYSGSGTISTSGASVEVYKGDELIAVYNAPLNQGSEIYWNVFVLDALSGTITPVNTITNLPTNYMSLFMTDSAPEDEILNIIAKDIQNAPKK